MTEQNAKNPGPKKKQRRHQTTNPSACLGQNQQLILQLLRKGPRGKRDLREDFITTAFQERPVNSGHGSHRQLGSYKFDQAIRVLQKRYLIKTVVHNIQTKGCKDPTFELTETGKDIIDNRRSPTAMKKIIIGLLNDRIRKGQRDIATREILEELAKRGITGKHADSHIVGQVLHKCCWVHYLVSGHDSIGRQHRNQHYLLPEKTIICSNPPKRFEPNYKKKSRETLDTFVFFE